MIIVAVYTGDVLIAQFDDAEDADKFVRDYGSDDLPMYTKEQEEDYNRHVFTYMPTDAFCRELIAYKTGVRLP